MNSSHLKHGGARVDEDLLAVDEALDLLGGGVGVDSLRNVAVGAGCCGGGQGAAGQAGRGAGNAGQHLENRDQNFRHEKGALF